MKNWKFDDGKKTGTGSIHLDNKQQVVDNYVKAFNDNVSNNEKFRDEVVQYRASNDAAKADLKKSYNSEWVPKWNSVRADV